MIIKNDIEQKFLNLDIGLQDEQVFAAGPINRPIVNLSLPAIKNPFIELAVPLFVLADTIKNQKEPPADAAQFRQKLLQHINSLTAVIKKQNITMSAFTTARYFLCCYLDEIILNTDWARSSRWGFESLLSTFHNDTNGGEKFFVILQQLTNNAGKNIYLLELAFLCLKFGFCGKYKVLSRGQEQIAMIEDDLYKEINQSLKQIHELHPKVPDVNPKKNSYYKYAPITLIIIAAVFCTGIWNYLHYKIENSTDIALVKLTSLTGTTPTSFISKINNEESRS